MFVVFGGGGECEGNEYMISFFSCFLRLDNDNIHACAIFSKLNLVLPPLNPLVSCSSQQVDK